MLPNHTDNNPLVSIAMATYNGGQFLRAQMDSLLHQTYSNIEIVISDDHSTDDTVAIIQSYQSKHPNIVLIENAASPGIRNNFSNALQHCKGSLVALCDQDDIWMPQKISTLVHAIDGHQLVYHNSLFVNEAGQSLEKTIADEYHCYSGNDPRAFLLQNCVSGHACLFRASLLAKAMPFPVGRYHDWWLAFVAAAQGSVQYVPEILVHYRQHALSKTDILKRRNDHRHAGALVKHQQEQDWYERAAAIESAHRPFLLQWSNEFSRLEKQWFNPVLWQMAMRHRDLLFSLSKDSTLAQISRINELATGVPVKKIFL